MTRKDTRNTSVLRGIASLIAVLTVMIALAALAQTKGAGQPTGNSYVVPAQAKTAARPNPASAASVVSLFRPAASYHSDGWYAQSVAVADVNGDGKPDLVVANWCDRSETQCVSPAAIGTVGVLLGNGDGTFQSVVSYASGGSDADSVAVADVNGDGKLDLVVANLCEINNCSGVVGVLLGNGDGTFKPSVTYSAGDGETKSVAIADVNGDGRLDLLVANAAHNTVGVLLGKGDGTFQPAVTYASSAGGPEVTWSLVVADVNGDGMLDLVVANDDDNCLCGNGRVGVLLGNGDGTFQPVVLHDSGGPQTRSVAVADVNGDGKADLLVASSDSAAIAGAVGVLLGNGDGTFQPVVTYGSGGFVGQVYSVSVAVADVNGDGKPDLVVANPCDTGAGFGCLSGSGVVGVLFGNGDGTFQSALTYHSGLHSWSVAVADVNGDHRQDVVVSTWTQIGTVDVLLNNPSAWKTTMALATSGSPSRVGQSVTFTAKVTWSYGTIPDGELVKFYDGATPIGTGVTASGVATFTTSSLTAKTHTIKAAYAGDLRLKPSTGTVTQVVSKYPTTTTLASSPNPSQFGQVVTFTAQVTSTGPAPTGSVKFLDGTTGIGLVTLSGGVAELTKSTLAVGTHSITAHYNGDAASSTSTSAVVNQVVQ